MFPIINRGHKFTFSAREISKLMFYAQFSSVFVYETRIKKHSCKEESLNDYGLVRHQIPLSRGIPRCQVLFSEVITVSLSDKKVLVICVLQSLSMSAGNTASTVVRE